MTALQIAGDLLALYRTQRLDPPALRHLQEARLRQVVEHAYTHVPFWRRRMDAYGIPPAEIRTLEDLKQFPVTTRAELQQVPLADLTSDAFPPAALSRVMTTGSTGRPLTVSLDRRQVQRRKGLFLRALMASGMYPGQSMLLIAHDRGRTAPPWLRWRYASPDLPAAELAAIVAATRPTNLYGWVTPLRQLAIHAREHGVRLPRARHIFTTAEALDDATSRLLADQLGATPSAIYGSVELGSMAWECRAHAGLHLAEDSTLLEFLPVPGATGICRVIATSLETLGTPLIRYDTGDLAPPPIRSACTCGSRFARIQRIEGRLVDSIKLSHGRLVSPYLLTEAIETVAGLDRYQIIQESLDRFVVRVDGHPADRAAAEAADRWPRALGDSGGQRRCHLWDEILDPPSGRKFRVVECRMSL